jgi:phosphatidylglycerol:prolipoprotein diacylglycerol transferase
LRKCFGALVLTVTPCSGECSIEIGIDPLAFSLGPVHIAWYGIMVAASIAFLVIWVWHFARKAGFKGEFVLGGAIWAIPMGVIVSRLVHVIDKYDYYFSNPREIIGFEGLTIYGAILGGLLGAWIYCRIRRVSFAHLADLAAPGIILAQAIGRVGCIINGCCSGKETSLPFHLIYTHPASDAITSAPLGTPLHPTQLYEIFGDLLIFALLFWLFRGRLRPRGSQLAVYLFLYSALTFTVRFWRGDTQPFAGFLQEGQLISVLIMVFAFLWIVWRTRWGRIAAEPVSGALEELPGDSGEPLDSEG